MKKILIINPPVYDFKLYDEWMNSQGLLVISSLLEQSGFQVIYQDFLYSQAIQKKYGTGFFQSSLIEKPKAISFTKKNFKRYGINKEEIIEFIKNTDYDLALVGSFLTYWYLGSYEVINILKQIHPNRPVWLGGIYATLCPEHAAQSGADKIVQGAFNKNMIQDIAKFLKVDVTIKEKNICPYVDISKVIHKPYFSLSLSLGCPFQCSYCAASILQPEYKSLSNPPIEYFIQGYENGIRDIAFFDDALLYQFEELNRLIVQLEKAGLYFRYHTPNGMHIKEIDEKKAEFLFNHRFKTLRFGLESLDIDTQRASGYKATEDKITKGIGYLKKAGFKKNEMGFYLLLTPNQSEQKIEMTKNYLMENRVNCHLNLYSPIPKTKEFDQIAENYPELREEPLLHNDTVFLEYSKIWDMDWVEGVKKEIREYNSKTE